MLNVNPTTLEYVILGIALICVTIITALRVLPIDNGVTIITGIITYAIGNIKGASVVNAIQQTNTGK